ncbi:unnamed protein product [Brugia pahangi]|uniref:Uncharacterized protein n=1 Tax=Brugia pahangi TaxID=6280 RepID=A0A0N4TB38_BRUPA|nr:unnamed protein product [Brugia pahangi]
MICSTDWTLRDPPIVLSLPPIPKKHKIKQNEIINENEMLCYQAEETFQSFNYPSFISSKLETITQMPISSSIYSQSIDGLIDAKINNPSTNQLSTTTTTTTTITTSAPSSSSSSSCDIHTMSTSSILQLTR